MPTYDYHCQRCDETFEVWQSITDDPLTKHERCGGKVTKVFAPVGIAFKGSGFYKNDHGSRSGGARREKTDDKKDSTSTSSSTESKSSDSTSKPKDAKKSA